MMEKTRAAELAQKYLALGGKRKGVADDNAISTRLWASEPAEAAQFWKSEIAPLPKRKREEIESLLPSISGDSK